MSEQRSEPFIKSLVKPDATAIRKLAQDIYDLNKKAAELQQAINVIIATPPSSGGGEDLAATLALGNDGNALDIVNLAGLQDSVGDRSIDIENRQLVNALGFTWSVDWENRLLADSIGQYGIDWENRLLIDNTLTNVFDWQNRALPQLAGGGVQKLTVDNAGIINVAALDDEYFTITLNHGNTSPNDATAVWFAWRYGLGGEAQKFNNPAIVPFDCEIVKVQMTWRAATGSAAGDVRDFYVSVWTNAVPPVNISDTIALSTNLVIGADLNGWAESGALTIAASAGNLIWMHYVGPYATNPINLLLTAILTCKKT